MARAAAPSCGRTSTAGAESGRARRRRHWAEAERLRAELDALGVAVEDTPDGTKWTKAGDRLLILDGRHPVLEALRSGARRIDEVLVEREAGGRGADIVALARQAGIRYDHVPRMTLTAIAGTPHHQGVVARVAPRPYTDLDVLLSGPRRRGEAGLFLLLDQVQDPGNLGNLLRTAEALGAHGVVLLRHQAVGLTGHAVKAAAGALEYLPVARVGNLVQTLDILKQEGCWVVGASATPPDLPPPWRSTSGARSPSSWGARGGGSGRWSRAGATP